MSAKKVVEDFQTRSKCCGDKVCDASFILLESLVDEAIADARADERIKTSAEIYAKIGRVFCVRTAGGES